MRQAKINTAMITRLNILTEQIRKNVADVNDYQEYEDLLVKSGAFTRDEILKNITDLHLCNYGQFVLQRTVAREADSLELYKKIEGIAVVQLVSYGLAIIFASYRGQRIDELEAENKNLRKQIEQITKNNAQHV